MTIQEAIEKAPRFKRKDWSHFYFRGSAGYIVVDDGSARVGALSVEDLLATDWEVKEEPEPISMEVSIQARFEKIESRLGKVESELKSLLNNLNTHVKNLWACYGSLSSRMDGLERELTELTKV